ncbi:hypothetical protein [Allosalinactinospora lopnorensis]|uniref:hypothetical protein n=1 Tax=Allosalinactinospora lopnorensis TaxID=1352348 RepID=UPI0012E26D0E|nr:hypothetical protein [Allosalinactinospora lopnorensis]
MANDIALWRKINQNSGNTGKLIMANQRTDHKPQAILVGRVFRPAPALGSSITLFWGKAFQIGCRPPNQWLKINTPGADPAEARNTKRKRRQNRPGWREGLLWAPNPLPGRAARPP